MRLNMKLNKNAVRALAASAVVAALVTFPAIPASAQVIYKLCTNGGAMYGVSNSSLGRSVEDVDCGRVSVRVYYAHPGGASWTAWNWSASLVDVKAPNISKAEHKADYRATFSTNALLP